MTKCPNKYANYTPKDVVRGKPTFVHHCLGGQYKLRHSWCRVCLGVIYKVGIAEYCAWVIYQPNWRDAIDALTLEHESSEHDA